MKAEVPGDSSCIRRLYLRRWLCAAQHQELTGGAYATSFAMGTLVRYGAVLHEQVGPLLFGSSDVAGLGYQHFDGAIRVGTRLAERVLAGR